MLINALKLLYLNAIKRVLLILNLIKCWIKSECLMEVATFPSGICIVAIQNHQALLKFPLSSISTIL